MEEKPKYNVQRHRKATVNMSLRTVMSLYLAYMGWQVAKTSGGDSPIKPWLGWLIFALFGGIAIAFGVYTYKNYKADLKDAEVRPEELEAEKQEQQEP